MRSFHFLRFVLLAVLFFFGSETELKPSYLACECFCCDIVVYMEICMLDCCICDVFRVFFSLQVKL